MTSKTGKIIENEGDDGVALVLISEEGETHFLPVKTRAEAEQILSSWKEGTYSLLRE